MKLIKKLALAAAFLSCTAANASTLTYAFNGPAFTNVSGQFTKADRITGLFSFDSSLLTAEGNGHVVTSSNNFNPNITWSFQDGHNVFNNTITRSNFAISVDFAGYNASAWNIDTTFNVTSNADIFINSYNGSYISYYRGGSATSSTAFTTANVSRVPEPGSLALAGIGLLGLVAARRKQQQAK